MAHFDMEMGISKCFPCVGSLVGYCFIKDYYLFVFSCK